MASTAGSRILRNRKRASTLLMGSSTFLIAMMQRSSAFLFSPPKVRSLYNLNKNNVLLQRPYSSFLASSMKKSSASYTKTSQPQDVHPFGTDQYLESLGLKASRYGLDPFQNRFSCPIVYHEKYSFPEWPENHTFPMDKFDRIAHALQSTSSKSIEGSQLPRPLVRREQDFFRPLDFEDVPIDDWLCSIINPEFVHRFLKGQLTTEEARYIGFREQISRPELIQRTILEVAGTVLTAQLAHHFGIAANVAGGTHHAHPWGGAGYTILNDLAVTANFLTDERLHGGSTTGIDRVLVIDCDVHQGDGTAKFSTLWNDQQLATLSMHCASNYPQQKANSTYDIGLRDKCGDDEYMDILERCVEKALKEVEPDLVLYDAGVDVHEHDKLGRLRVTEDGIRRRDRWVLERCVSLGIPVAAVVGGGYDEDVDALARRHAIVHEECSHVWRKYQMWKQ